jgi:hypothetical protein
MTRGVVPPALALTTERGCYSIKLAASALGRGHGELHLATVVDGVGDEMLEGNPQRKEARTQLIGAPAALHGGFEDPRNVARAEKVQPLATGRAELQARRDRFERIDYLLVGIEDDTRGE